MSKLSTRFDSIAREQEKQFEQIRGEVQANVKQVATETRTVFDTIMKDLDSLQNETEKMQTSKALEELENHLTDRITLLTKNSLDMNSTQRESYKNLTEKLDDQIQKMKENKKK